jgi:hypothetical protein
MVGWVNDLHENGIAERGRQGADAPAEQNSSEFKGKKWILIDQYKIEAFVLSSLTLSLRSLTN